MKSGCGLEAPRGRSLSLNSILSGSTLYRSPPMSGPMVIVRVSFLHSGLEQPMDSRLSASAPSATSDTPTEDVEDECRSFVTVCARLQCGHTQLNEAIRGVCHPAEGR